MRRPPIVANTLSGTSQTNKFEVQVKTLCIVYSAARLSSCHPLNIRSVSVCPLGAWVLAVLSMLMLNAKRTSSYEAGPEFPDIRTPVAPTLLSAVYSCALRSWLAVRGTPAAPTLDVWHRTNHTTPATHIRRPHTTHHTPYRTIPHQSAGIPEASAQG